ncbi:hypothetical protein A2154_04665 [Candidatus Gottesmanbacteria bacterium RBG_16_43_7]|uniref:Uncharacterized protein n=1 Tax=Candidatus Gottesmanbacteria bacterium RBG_16_43_7 TaxID=1798373 RepID=A0A1F5Z7K9_9BACT|nr:MAG: hypothetical protein A2154_04665 [Candidatus Gottesmanbacteria bacterium RBG_16_43_7]
MTAQQEIKGENKRPKAPRLWHDVIRGTNGTAYNTDAFETVAYQIGNTPYIISWLSITENNA